MAAKILEKDLDRYGCSLTKNAFVNNFVRNQFNIVEVFAQLLLTFLILLREEQSWKLNASIIFFISCMAESPKNILFWTFLLFVIHLLPHLVLLFVYPIIYSCSICVQDWICFEQFWFTLNPTFVPLFSSCLSILWIQASHSCACCRWHALVLHVFVVR